MAKPLDRQRKPPNYRSLMAFRRFTTLSSELALERIAFLIDACDSSRRASGITRALEWCDLLEARDLTPIQRVELSYFRANAWDKRRPRYKSQAKAAWRWEQPALQEEILCLRRALISEGFGQLPRIRRCQIITNLGNQLSTAGRTIEALDQWSNALAIDPNFWMARGSRGRGLSEYARSVYGEYQAAVIFLRAHLDLAQALEDADKLPQLGYPEARAYFEQEMNRIGAQADIPGIAQAFNLDEPVKAKSAAERSYRNWCLANQLFLNPIGDAFKCALAAEDSLMLPDFVTKLREPPVFIGFFNQLKQEYVSARWAYYSGTRGKRGHFSDREVALSNTLDYPSYGLAIEKVRTSYRVAYSLLDKVAYFINSYFDLGIPLSSVSFKRVWLEKKGKDLRVASRFDRSKNSPLRGLYWLSKDLHEPSLKEVMNPDAIALSDIRNHLEHRYLKVHEMTPRKEGIQAETDDIFVDTMSYSIARTDFEEKALRVLKISRLALMHLAFGMHQEEQRRQRARRSRRPIAAQSLPMIYDGWKR